MVELAVYCIFHKQIVLFGSKEGAKVITIFNDAAKKSIVKTHLKIRQVIAKYNALRILNPHTLILCNNNDNQQLINFNQLSPKAAASITKL